MKVSYTNGSGTAKNTPWKINGWNLQITHLEIHLHDYVPAVNLQGCINMRSIHPLPILYQNISSKMPKSTLKLHGIVMTTCGRSRIYACIHRKKIYHLESRWRNSHVLVYHGPLLSHLVGVAPSTFSKV